MIACVFFESAITILRIALRIGLKLDHHSLVEIPKAAVVSNSHSFGLILTLIFDRIFAIRKLSVE